MIIPIALMSFDRPDYLEAVLQTLVRQRSFGCWTPHYYLFQDGAEVRNTGTLVADPIAIKQSIDVFKQYIPQGEIFAARYNLGVAHNFDRAERLFFQDLMFPCAVFLEDDMLLQQHYFEVIIELLEIALKTPYIGMVSAYGLSGSIPVSEQRRLARSLCLMNEHNWAFGITRQCWLSRQQLVSRYLDILDDIPYRERSSKHPEIKDLLRSVGRGGRGYLSSQDSIKNAACEVLGIYRVSTFTTNSRYIGKKGLHMTEERFAERGYDQTILYPTPHTGFYTPTIEELRNMRVVR